MEDSERFDAELSKFLTEDIPSTLNMFETDMTVSKLHISTITMGFKSEFGIDIWEIDEITCKDIIYELSKSGFADIKGISLDNVEVPFSVEDEGTANATSRARKERRKFSNARILRIKFKSGSRVCFMIFGTGSIQVKGCKSSVLATRLCEVILSTINGFATTVHDLDIQLINSNFGFNRYINRDNLYKALLEDGMTVTYDPNVYAAVKWRVQHNDGRILTVATFGKGNVIITGAKEIAHLHGAFAFVVNYFVRNGMNKAFINNESPVQEQNDKAPKKRGRKRKADKEAVYDSLDL